MTGKDKKEQKQKQKDCKFSASNSCDVYRARHLDIGEKASSIKAGQAGFDAIESQSVTKIVLGLREPRCTEICGKGNNKCNSGKECECTCNDPARRIKVGDLIRFSRCLDSADSSCGSVKCGDSSRACSGTKGKKDCRKGFSENLDFLVQSLEPSKKSRGSGKCEKGGQTVSLRVRPTNKEAASDKNRLIENCADYLLMTMGPLTDQVCLPSFQLRVVFDPNVVVVPEKGEIVVNNFLKAATSGLFCSFTISNTSCEGIDVTCCNAALKTNDIFRVVDATGATGVFKDLCLTDKVNPDAPIKGDGFYLYFAKNLGGAPFPPFAEKVCGLNLGPVSVGPQGESGGRKPIPFWDRDGKSVAQLSKPVRLISDPAGSGDGSGLVRHLLPPGTWEWGARISGLLSEDTFSSVPLDSDICGNVYMCGRYESNPVSFYNGLGVLGATGTLFETRDNAGDRDFFLGKIASNGLWDWITRVSGNLDEQDIEVKTDNCCHTYMGGAYASNPLTFYNKEDLAQFALPGGPGVTELFISRMRPEGDWQWAARIGGMTNLDVELCPVIRTDCGCNAYMTFLVFNYDANTNIVFTDGIDGGETGLASLRLPFRAVNETILSKIAPDGAWQWASQIVTINFNFLASDLQLGAGDNNYLTGGFNFTLELYAPIYRDNGLTGSIAIGLASDGSATFVGKFSDLGQWQWAAQIDGGLIQEGLTQIDRNGHLNIVGNFRTDTATFRNAIYSGTGQGDIAFTLAKSGQGSIFSDTFVARIDSDGFWMWGARIGGINTDFPAGLALDCCNNIYVSGRFRSPLVSFYDGYLPNDTASVGSTGRFAFSLQSLDGDPELDDVFIGKINSDGLWQWAAQVGGTGDVNAGKTLVDSCGNVYVVGSYTSSISFFNGIHRVGGQTGTLAFTLTNNGLRDVFVAMIDTNGQWRWAINVTNTTATVHLDKCDNLFLLGTYQDTANFQTGPTLENPDGPQTDCFSLIHEGPTGTSDLFLARIPTDESKSVRTLGFLDKLVEGVTGPGGEPVYTVAFPGLVSVGLLDSGDPLISGSDYYLDSTSGCLTPDCCDSLTGGCGCRRRFMGTACNASQLIFNPEQPPCSIASIASNARGINGNPICRLPDRLVAAPERPDAVRSRTVLDAAGAAQESCAAFLYFTEQSFVTTQGATGALVLTIEDAFGPETYNDSYPGSSSINPTKIVDTAMNRVVNPHIIPVDIDIRIDLQIRLNMVNQGTAIIVGVRANVFQANDVLSYFLEEREDFQPANNNTTYNISLSPIIRVPGEGYVTFEVFSEANGNAGDQEIEVKSRDNNSPPTSAGSFLAARFLRIKPDGS